MPEVDRFASDPGLVLPVLQDDGLVGTTQPVCLNNWACDADAGANTRMQRFHRQHTVTKTRRRTWHVDHAQRCRARENRPVSTSTLLHGLLHDGR